MTSEQFIFWIQGFFEIQDAGRQSQDLTKEQVDVIKRHLALVFIHDIDPKQEPNQVKSDILNDIHNKDNGVYRC